MADEIMIPMLPCKSIKDVVDFYRVLGFEIPYENTRPNPYAVVRRGGIEIQFFGMPGYDPAQSYSTCLVSVPDADQLYAEFATAIRQHYGKMLSAGIPRFTRLRTDSYGSRGFKIIDPGGNWIRIVGRKPVVETVEEKVNPTALSRAIGGADFLTDTKGEYAAAAEVLDKALAKEDAGTTVQRVQALVARTGLAITLDDPQTARSCLTEIRQITLTDEERAALTAELQNADDFEKTVQHS